MPHLSPIKRGVSVLVFGVLLLGCGANDPATLKGWSQSSKVHLLLFNATSVTSMAKEKSEYEFVRFFELQKPSSCEDLGFAYIRTDTHAQALQNAQTDKNATNPIEEELNAFWDALGLLATKDFDLKHFENKTKTSLCTEHIPNQANNKGDQYFAMVKKI